MATTILVEEKTRDTLKLFGHKDETYDKIINRLMKVAEMQEFFAEQKQVLKKERFFKAEDL